MAAVLTAVPMATPDFRAVYESEFRYVWNTLRRLGTRDRDLEDLCHEVFIVFYRTLDEYDAARPLKPWLFGISFRVCSDYRRRAGYRFEVPVDAHDPACQRPHADEQLVSEERRKLVLRALEALEIDRRAVFIMHDLDGHSMPEIAQVIDAPINTLYSRLRLARVQFQEVVRRLQGNKR